MDFHYVSKVARSHCFVSDFHLLFASSRTFTLLCIVGAASWIVVRYADPGYINAQNVDAHSAVWRHDGLLHERGVCETCQVARCVLGFTDGTYFC